MVSSDTHWSWYQTAVKVMLAVRWKSVEPSKSTPFQSITLTMRWKTWEPSCSHLRMYHCDLLVQTGHGCSPRKMLRVMARTLTEQKTKEQREKLSVATICMMVVSFFFIAHVVSFIHPRRWKWFIVHSSSQHFMAKYSLLCLSIVHFFDVKQKITTI